MDKAKYQYEMRALFDDSPIGIAVVSPKTNKRLYVNKRLIEMFGAKSEADLLSRKIEDSWVNPEIMLQTRTIIAENKGLVNFKAERRRMDGSIWWVQMNSQLIEFEGEQARAIWHADITDQQKAEDEVRKAHDELEIRVAERTDRLAKSEKRFRDFADISSDWYWEMDSDLRYTFISQAYEEISGKKISALLGRTRREMYSGQVKEEAEAWNAFLDGLDRHEDFEGFVYTYKRPNGEQKVMSNNGRAIFDDEGKFLGYRGIGVDVTDLYEAENALKSSEEMYRHLFEREKTIVHSLPDILCILDQDGRYLEVITDENNLLVTEVSELIGKTIFDILPEELAQHMSMAIHQALETNELTLIEYHMDVPKGARYFEARITPLNSEGAEKKQVLFIGRDITERIEADKVKAEFTATISHELRTPLTAITGALGVIQSGVAGSLTEVMKSMVDISYSNCDRLTMLINDILDIEKIESGKMVSYMEPMDVVPLIDEVISSNQDLVETYGVTFKNTTCDAKQQSVLVYGDKKRLMQALSNLMSNAAKFSQQGEEVNLYMTHDDNTVRIAIEDHGVGVPSEYKKHIFTKFTQVDSSDTRQIGGTGLGLSIAEAIVRQHGGQIELESEVGVGSVFFFDLTIIE
jgi:PAS domain S-box-containing protein